MAYYTTDSIDEELDSITQDLTDIVIRLFSVLESDIFKEEYSVEYKRKVSDAFTSIRANRDLIKT